MVDPLLILFLQGVNLQRRLLPDGGDRSLGQPQDTPYAEELEFLRVPNLLKVLVGKKVALEVHIGKRIVRVRESLQLEEPGKLGDHWLDVPDDNVVLGSSILLNVEGTVEEDLLEHA